MYEDKEHHYPRFMLNSKVVVAYFSFMPVWASDAWKSQELYRAAILFGSIWKHPPKVEKDPRQLSEYSQLSYYYPLKERPDP